MSRCLGLLTLVGVLALVLYVLLARQLMVMLPDFKDVLEQQLSNQLRTPVRIAALSGHMDGITPVFDLQGLAVQSATGSGPPLAVQRLSLAVDVPRSLWARSLALRQLWISGLALHLERDPEGHVRLYGVEALDGGSGNLDTLLDVLYRQQRVVLDDVQARLDWPGLPPLRADDLSLALVKHGNQRQLAVRFSAVDQPFSADLRLRLDGEPRQLSELAGDGYLELSGEQLEYWLPEQWPLPVAPVSAAGRVELWGQLREGRLLAGSGRFSTHGVTLTHTDADADWTLEQLDAEFDLRTLARGGYQLTVQHLSGRTREQGELSLGPVALWWDGRVDQQFGWQLRTGSISATAVRDQLLAWPFPLQTLAGLRDELQAWAPEGRIEGLYLRGEGRHVTEFSARVTELGLQAGQQRPGVQGVTGWVTGTPDGGHAWLDSSALRLTLPHLYDAPLELALTGPLHWWRDQSGTLQLDSGRLALANDDARAQALFSVLLPPQGLPQLRLRGEVFDGRAARAAHYIPMVQTSPAARRWLQEAFVDGQVERGRFLYEGPIRVDPARPQDRTFQMVFALAGLELQFLPDWPRARDINGSLVIDNFDFRARDLSAEILDTQIRAAQVDLIDLVPEHAPLLVVQGDVDGPGSDLQTLFWASPLAAVLPEALSQWQFGGGRIQGRLLLQQPLSDHSAGRQEVLVQGRVEGLRLVSEQWRLTLDDLHGDGEFSLQRGLQFPSISGRLLGSPVQGRVLTRREDLLVEARGPMPVATVQRWLQQPWLAPLSGQLNYRGQLQLPRHGGSAPRFQLDTDLNGVSSLYPAPLGKPAAHKLPLSLVVRGAEQGTRISAVLEGLGAAHLALDQDGGLQRGAVRFAAPGVSLPEQGWVIDGQVRDLDLPGWVALLAADDNPFAGGGGGLTSLRLALDADDVQLAAQRLGATRLVAQNRGGGWLMGLNSARLAGELYLPPDYRQRGDTPLVADIERLVWPFSDVVSSDPARWESLTPDTVPVADLSVRNLVVHGTAYGDWQGQLRPRDHGTVLQGLHGQWGATVVTGDVQWWQQEGLQYSALNGHLASKDLGALLRSAGVDHFADSRNASAHLDLRWQGGLLDFDPRALQGTMDVTVEQASLYASDRHASALKVLGLLNIGNTLTRRLRLDFSDLADDGLLADRVRGTFQFDGPRIDTDNLRIRSAAAEFEIAGRLDVVAQTLDYQIDVTLPLSSNLYAGCLAGPAACAGIFVVERLWGDRLEKMTSMKYHVAGPWDSPRVNEKPSDYAPTEEH
ncbi:YhdP family protein [Isoalcanivorax beigongshangi]|uniref:YhdP family protein n=1 Tax=Isoalcanivorax beigongshangi TaxID=3238810 RepID=A0ABV4AIX6_9GAMM